MNKTFARIALLLIIGMGLGLSAKAEIKIPETVKVEKDYKVDGKSVSKAEALMSAVQGKQVVVCDPYRAEMSKSGTISLKKIK